MDKTITIATTSNIAEFEALVEELQQAIKRVKEFELKITLGEVEQVEVQSNQ
jgi:hypothetical protein